jgi:NitT/TauT family transport system substrate-binding protein
MDQQRRQWLTMALSAAGAAAWPAHAALSVSVALSARNSLYHLPLVLADRLGYFRQLGLQVQLIAHESGHAAVGSVLKGQADVLAGAFEHVFELQRRGQSFQAFAQMTATPMVSLGVTGSRSGLRSWQELKSARIGVSALHSGTHWMSSLWLLRHGVQPQDVSFVEVGTSATALGALWEGQVDALCNPDPVMHWLEQRGEVRVIAEARTHSGVHQLAAGPLPGGCLMAREEFLSRQPQVAQSLADGVLHALRWLQTAGPTDLFKTVPVAPWITDRSVYLGAMEKLREAFPRDALMHEDAVLNASRQHARVALTSPGGRAYSPRLFTNAFVSRSRPRTAG